MYQPRPQDNFNRTTHRPNTKYTDEPINRKSRDETPTQLQRATLNSETGVNYPFLGHWTYNNLIITLLFTNILVACYFGTVYLGNASTLTDEIASGSWHTDTISRDVDLSFNRQRMKTEEFYDTKTTEILSKISSESNSIRNSYNDKIGDVEKELNYQATKIANLERKILDLTRIMKLGRVIMPCGEESYSDAIGE